MKDGILNINKPSGWTSQDVCSRLRHRLHIKKTGHTGTLDPMATGVLPVCIGKATRIIEYYDQDLKSYHAGMKLGCTSDTLDIWGEVSEICDVRILKDMSGHDSCTDDLTGVCISESSILKCFEDYTGTIAQIPPRYSALRINGKRAYDLARAGADFEIKPREITIYSNVVSDIDTDSGIIEFDVTCSKGTYIRTICDDIGRELGCGAVMSSLVRTGSGCFRIEEAADLNELIEMSDEEIGSLIVPMDRTLVSLGIISLDDNRLSAFINGNPSGSGYRVTQDSDFTVTEGKFSGCGIYRVYNRDIFLGTGYLSGRDLIPAKVIYR